MDLYPCFFKRKSGGVSRRFISLEGGQITVLQLLDDQETFTVKIDRSLAKAHAVVTETEYLTNMGQAGCNQISEAAYFGIKNEE